MLLAALWGCGILLHSSLEAEEGGSGHYLPGSMSSFVDAPPPKGAFIARYNMVYYNGDLSVNRTVAHRRLADAGRGCHVVGAWPDAGMAAAD